MAKTPRQVLLENEASVKTAIEDFLSPQAIIAVTSTADLTLEINGIINTPNQDPGIQKYTTAIDKLHELRDKRRGIHWKRTDADPENGIIGTIIRDARLQSEVSEDTIYDNKISHQIEYMNFIRTASKLLDVQKRTGDKPQDSAEAKKILDLLAIKFTQAMDKIESDNQALPILELNKLYAKKLEQFQTALVIQLSNVTGIADKKEIGIRLNATKDFMNYEDTHNHIVTLTAVEKRIIIEADVAILGTTEAQKTKITDELENLTKKRESCFDPLEDWQRELLIDYLAKQIDGLHVNPTQLGKFTVGLRNAYNKLTAIAVEDQETSYVHQVLHSGSEVSLNDNTPTKRELTDLTIDQTLALAPPTSKRIEIISLNTNSGSKRNKIVKAITNKITDVAGFKAERQIVEELGEAVVRANKDKDELAVTHSVVQLNYFSSAVGSNISDSITDFLEAFASKLDPNNEKLTPIKSYLTGETTDINLALTALVKYKAALAPDDYIMLSSAIDIKSGELSSPNLAAKLSILGDKINHGSGSILTLDNRAALYRLQLAMCKSGKDRTGLFLLNTTIQAIMLATGLAEDLVANAIVNSGHTQFMSSMQGGSHGCESIKDYVKLTTALEQLKDKFTKDVAGHNNFAYEANELGVAILNSIVKEHYTEQLQSNPIWFKHVMLQQLKFAYDNKTQDLVKITGKNTRELKNEIDLLTSAGTISPAMILLIQHQQANFDKLINDPLLIYGYGLHKRTLTRANTTPLVTSIKSSPIPLRRVLSTPAILPETVKISDDLLVVSSAELLEICYSTYETKLDQLNLAELRLILGSITSEDCAALDQEKAQQLVRNLHIAESNFLSYLTTDVAAIVCNQAGEAAIQVLMKTNAVIDPIFIESLTEESLKLMIADTNFSEFSNKLAKDLQLVLIKQLNNNKLLIGLTTKQLAIMPDITRRKVIELIFNHESQYTELTKESHNWLLTQLFTTDYNVINILDPAIKKELSNCQHYDQEIELIERLGDAGQQNFINFIKEQKQLGSISAELITKLAISVISTEIIQALSAGTIQQLIKHKRFNALYAKSSPELRLSLVNAANTHGLTSLISEEMISGLDKNGLGTLLTNLDSKQLKSSARFALIMHAHSLRLADKITPKMITELEQNEIGSLLQHAEFNNLLSSLSVENWVLLVNKIPIANRADDIAEQLISRISIDKILELSPAQLKIILNLQIDKNIINMMAAQLICNDKDFVAKIDANYIDALPDRFIAEIFPQGQDLSPEQEKFIGNLSKEALATLLNKLDPALKTQLNDQQVIQKRVAQRTANIDQIAELMAIPTNPIEAKIERNNANLRSVLATLGGFFTKSKVKDEQIIQEPAHEDKFVKAFVYKSPIFMEKMTKLIKEKKKEDLGENFENTTAVKEWDKKLDEKLKAHYANPEKYFEVLKRELGAKRFDEEFQVAKSEVMHIVEQGAKLSHLKQSSRIQTDPEATPSVKQNNNQPILEE